jgi:hypothetical protein
MKGCELILLFTTREIADWEKGKNSPQFAIIRCLQNILKYIVLGKDRRSRLTDGHTRFVTDPVQLGVTRPWRWTRPKPWAKQAPWSQATSDTVESFNRRRRRRDERGQRQC